MLLFILLVSHLVLPGTPSTLTENLPECPPGLKGEKCNEKCPTGWFGDGCLQKCACENNAYCSPVDGECDCRHKTGENGTRGDTINGWEGLLCDRPCRRGFWGTLCSFECPCKHGQGDCDPVTSECQCLTGFMERECMLTCNEFEYGLNCNKSCKCSKNSAGCDHVTGRCICHKGWHGWICDSKCADGLWGEDCNRTCNCGPGIVPCRQDNGTMCHCPPGVNLDSNGLCTKQCPKGSYGYGCEESCAVWRERSLTGAYIGEKNTCDPVTGDLNCLPGYEGVDCKNSCPSGKFGPQCQAECKCVNGDCHHVTGECRCFKGWTGSTCDERCPQGTFGYNCTLKCMSCLNGGFCRGRNECICVDGWTGVACGLLETKGLMDGLERSSIRISLTLAALLLIILLVLLLIFVRFTQSERVVEYEVTRINDESHVFDGCYRDMVRVS